MNKVFTNQCGGENAARTSPEGEGVANEDIESPRVEKCERLDPEIGHEDEGYSCSTHNMPWDECPHRPARTSTEVIG